MQESHTSDGSVSVGISLMLPCPAYDVVGRRAIPVRRHLPHLCARWSAASRSLDYSVLQFFCTHCPCQPNATTMRTLAGAIVNPCKIPENYAKSISAQRQTDGRRAGLKIRSSQEGVGSSPTFGTEMSASRLKVRRLINPAVCAASNWFGLRSFLSARQCEATEIRNR
jgi:hypothetical protein